MDVGTIVAWIQLAVWLAAAAAGAARFFGQREDGGVRYKLRLSQTAIYALVILGLLISSISLYFSYRPRIVEKTIVQTIQQPPKQRIIVAWGSPDASTCQATLNTAPLSDLKDKYDVALICGIADPTTDKFEDQRITVTSLFTITLEDTPVSAALSKGMADAIQKLRADALKAVHSPKGTIVAVPITMWYEVVVLPKGTDTADVRKLSDVSRYGGKVLSQEGY